MVEYKEELTAEVALADSLVYNDVEINLPVVNSPKQAFIIHAIHFLYVPTTVGDAFDGDSDVIQAELLTKKGSALKNSYDDPYLVEIWRKVLAAGAAGSVYQALQKSIIYQKPKLIPFGKLYLAGAATDEGTLSVRIDYTIRWIKPKQLYDALTT